MTFTEWVYQRVAVDVVRGRPPYWRKGQYWFNELTRVRPDLASAIQGTPADPFYDDTRMDAFLRAVAIGWGP